MDSDQGIGERVRHPADLAHARPGVVPWALTAVALAAVLTIGLLVAPGDVSATQPVGGGTPAAGPAAADARYPIDCAGAPVVVAREVSADLDGDGRTDTAAAVHCQAGGGTPPHALFVLSHAMERQSPPRIVARLDNPDERMNVTELTVRGGMLAARLSGYSSPDVPSCCPDIDVRVEWRWNAGRFQPGEPVPAAAQPL